MGVVFDDDELKVLRLIAAGHPNKEISSMMRWSKSQLLSARTIIRAKMGAKNTAHMIAIAYKNDIIQ